ncbi:unnamed protein product [Caenorhabditis sp. 36 PRJEB53466]|nr:unnamed protein product [Caenorhabditis sp. 36 PRJEB53466]
MIIVSGNVTLFDSIHQTLDSGETWQECMAVCLHDAACVLVVRQQSSACLLFRAGAVKMVQKTDVYSGNVVAFKRTVPSSDSCPVEDDPPMFGVATVTETTDTGDYTLSRTTDTAGNTLWIYNFTCASDSFVSIRGLNTVCISARLFPDPYCRIKMDADVLCGADGGVGMSGPYNSAEQTVISAIFTAKVSAFSSSVKNLGYTWYNAWVDGTRQGPNEGRYSNYTATDNTLNNTDGYSWSTGQVFLKGRDICVYLDSAIFSANCNLTQLVSSSCFRGAICRTLPILE